MLVEWLVCFVIKTIVIGWPGFVLYWYIKAAGMNDPKDTGPYKYPKVSSIWPAFFWPITLPIWFVIKLTRFFFK